MSELKHMHAKIECLHFDTEDVRLVITERYGRQEIRMHGEDAKFIVEAIAAAKRRAQPEATKDDSLRTSLADLATALWRTHYRSDSPNFELLPDAAGILSQIDNMVSGLVKPEATKPAQDIGERNTQGPLLIARIKRYKEAFGCSTAEAKEACEYGRDLNSDQTAFVSPTKKDLSAAILALPLPDAFGVLHYNRATGFAGRLQGYTADQMRDLLKAAAALASPADALVAWDRVDVERTGTLYQAVQRAAGELPEGWTICLEIERDAGTVELIDPEGNRKLIDGNDGYLCQAVNEAINAAIQAQKDGHG